jgi:phage gpG-like protein
MIPLFARALAAGSDGRSRKSIEMLADTAALQKLAVKIKSLGPRNPHINRGLSQIAARWENAIKLNFRKSQDPYGNQWKEIKHRKGQPLLDTGALRNSIKSEVRGLSIVLGSPWEYAQTHQMGIRVHQRQFFPDPIRGLPDKWKSEYVKIMIDSVNKALEQ